MTEEREPALLFNPRASCSSRASQGCSCRRSCVRGPARRGGSPCLPAVLIAIVIAILATLPACTSAVQPQPQPQKQPPDGPRPSRRRASGKTTSARSVDSARAYRIGHVVPRGFSCPPAHPFSRAARRAAGSPHVHRSPLVRSLRRCPRSVARVAHRLLMGRRLVRPAAEGRAPGPINVASAEGDVDTSIRARAKDSSAQRYALPVGRSTEAGAMRPRR